MTNPKLEALKNRITNNVPSVPSPYSKEEGYISNPDFLPAKQVFVELEPVYDTLLPEPKQPKVQKTPQADQGMMNLANQLQSAINFFKSKS